MLNNSRDAKIKYTQLKFNSVELSPATIRLDHRFNKRGLKTQQQKIFSFNRSHLKQSKQTIY